MRFEDKLAQGMPLRIAVLGSREVGKSALSVRFLTRRFIGDYRSDSDILYKCSVNVDGATQPIEIMDTSPSSSDVTEAHLQWADAFVLVYSITDKRSFSFIRHLLELLSAHRPSCGTLVVGTKSDLGHLREVEEVEGRTLALSHSSRFSEVSSAEDYTSVAFAVDTFLREIKSISINTTPFSKSIVSLKGSSVHGSVSTSPRQKKMSVTRILGSLIGRASPPPTPITQLIVLDRNEFAKSKSPIRHL